MNEQYLDVPDGVGTRMILYLADDCDRCALVTEFESLPDTLLLFLKKLEYLTVEISLPSSPRVEFAYSISTNGDRVSIHKTLVSESSTKNYWVAKRTVTDMPEDKAREISSEDEEPRYTKEAVIILAFPLDDHDVPVIENQTRVRVSATETSWLQGQWSSYLK